MNVSVGRFEGYIPDNNPTDIVLSLLSRVGIKQKIITYGGIQSIVYDFKKVCPDLLNDIYFSETSFFPHSEEVDRAIHTLRCAGYIIGSRYGSYIIDVKSPIDAEWMTPEDKRQIEQFIDVIFLG